MCVQELRAAEGILDLRRTARFKVATVELVLVRLIEMCVRACMKHDFFVDSEGGRQGLGEDVFRPKASTVVLLSAS